MDIFELNSHSGNYVLNLFSKNEFNAAPLVNAFVVCAILELLGLVV